jgi:hypothetical protein
MEPEGSLPHLQEPATCPYHSWKKQYLNPLGTKIHFTFMWMYFFKIEQQM